MTCSHATGWVHLSPPTLPIAQSPSFHMIIKSCKLSPRFNYFYLSSTLWAPVWGRGRGASVPVPSCHPDLKPCPGEGRGIQQFAPFRPALLVSKTLRSDLAKASRWQFRMLIIRLVIYIIISFERLRPPLCNFFPLPPSVSKLSGSRFAFYQTLFADSSWFFENRWRPKGGKGEKIIIIIIVVNSLDVGKSPGCLAEAAPVWNDFIAFVVFFPHLPPSLPLSLFLLFNLVQRKGWGGEGRPNPLSKSPRSWYEKLPWNSLSGCLSL